MCSAITAYNPCFVVSMPTCVWSQESWSSNYWKAGSCCLLSMAPPIVHKYFDNQPLQFCNGLSHVWWASVKLWITIESLCQSWGTMRAGIDIGMMMIWRMWGQNLQSQLKYIKDILPCYWFYKGVNVRHVFVYVESLSRISVVLNTLHICKGIKK